MGIPATASQRSENLPRLSPMSEMKLGIPRRRASHTGLYRRPPACQPVWWAESVVTIAMTIITVNLFCSTSETLFFSEVFWVHMHNLTIWWEKVYKATLRWKSCWQRQDVHHGIRALKHGERGPTKETGAGGKQDDGGVIVPKDLSVDYSIHQHGIFSEMRAVLGWWAALFVIFGLLNGSAQSLSCTR